MPFDAVSAKRAVEQVLTTTVEDAAQNHILSREEQKNSLSTIAEGADAVRERKGPRRRALVDEVVAEVSKEAMAFAEDWLSDGVLSDECLAEMHYEEPAMGVLFAKADQVSRLDGPYASVNEDELTRQADSVSEIWGDENIMDGVISVQVGRLADGVVLGDGAIQLLRDRFSDDDMTWTKAPVADVEVSADAKAVRRAATMINHHGMQYAKETMIPRFAMEIDLIVTALGSAKEVDMVRVKGRTSYPDEESSDTTSHVFFNRETGHYAAFMTRNGSYY